MKKLYTFLFLSAFAAAAVAQTICNPSGNLMIFSNYDGGPLNIVVDANIPNLKIGVVTYEGTTISISGAFAANVTGVAYAGYNGNNPACGSPINTTISGAPGGATTNITLYPPAGLSNPNGNANLVCAYSCSTTTNQGGCNTVDQVENYFLTYFPGSQVYAHKVQYGCWTGNQSVAAGGTCCATPTGINDLSDEKTLTVFPNPASQSLQLSTETTMNNATIKIMSPSGQLIKEENNLSGNAFNVIVSGITPGVYFIEIVSEEIIYHTRFIKN